MVKEGSLRWHLSQEQKGETANGNSQGKQVTWKILRQCQGVREQVGLNVRGRKMTHPTEGFLVHYGEGIQVLVQVH